MSNCPYPAKPCGRLSLRSYAQELRTKLGLNNTQYIDIVRLMEFVFPQIFPNFHLEILSREEMGNNHGLTKPQEGVIYIREDVYNGACRGCGRDRFTMAHELGHYLLHRAIPTGLARSASVDNVPSYCDPEWQASAFAGEFLMGHNVIQGLSPAQIAQACCVSYAAACYQYRK